MILRRAENKPILVYSFTDAPQELRELTTQLDFKYVVLIPCGSNAANKLHIQAAQPLLDTLCIYGTHYCGVHHIGPKADKKNLHRVFIV